LGPKKCEILANYEPSSKLEFSKYETRKGQKKYGELEKNIPGPVLVCSRSPSQQNISI
jgi:hypothetical protein